MRASNSAGMPHAWELPETFGCLPDTRNDLRRCDGIALADVTMDFSDMRPGLRGITQPHRPHDFQSAAISSSDAKVPLPSRNSRWIRATSSA